MSTPRKKKTPKLPPGLLPTPDVNDLLAAASLLLTVLRRTKQHNLAALAAACELDPTVLTGACTLTEHQVALIEAHAGPLGGISVRSEKTSDGKNKTITTALAQCPSCGRISYIGSGATAATSCSLTSGCTGKPVKAKNATLA